MKKTPRNITLHICTINDNHMMYGSWDMECDGENFLLFWTIFLHFYPLTNSKNQNFEKMKKRPGDIVILHMCTTNDNHMMYGSWDMERDGQNLLSIWTIFCTFIPLTTRKIKILKKWKKHLTILSFYMCTINENPMMYSSWDMKGDRQNFLSLWTGSWPFTS